MMEQILVEYVQHYIDPVTLKIYKEMFTPVFKKVVQAICPKSTTDDTDLLDNNCSLNSEDNGSDSNNESGNDEDRR